MQLRKVLEREQNKLKVSWEAMEQDYVLSWVLFGMASVEELRKNLAFKGGTALKKIYFGNYRFSQDLDFTCLEGAPEGDRLENAIKDNVMNVVAQLKKAPALKKLLESKKLTIAGGYYHFRSGEVELLTEH